MVVDHMLLAQLFTYMEKNWAPASQYVNVYSL